MPIIEEPIPGSPLSQGDILKGIRLFETGGDWKMSQCLADKYCACLVLSRPCVVFHKERLVVAAVRKYAENPPTSVTTFKDVMDFLAVIRDGIKTPDGIYLGQIAQLGAGRYSAQLDSIHTLVLPTETRVRGELVKSHRIGRLTADFARDLHTRIFTAFAVQGFDDFRWYSDEDLRWVVSTGKAELAACEAELNKASASGFKNDSEKKSLESKFNDRKATIQPFEEELEKRPNYPNNGTSATG